MEAKRHYRCSCIPRQSIPHIVHSPAVEPYHLSVPITFGFPRRRLVIASLYKTLTPGLSCDNHPIPLRKWTLRIGTLTFDFGKIIY